MERPLAQGLLWGLFSGNWEVSLGVAIFYELFWLDLIPAGSYIPPNSSISTLIALGLVNYFGLSLPSQLVWPLLMSIPMALIARELEAYQRRLQNNSYNALLHWARSAHPIEHLPERLIHASLLQLLIMNFVLFSFGLLALIGCYTILQEHLPADYLVFPFSWGWLWILAAVGGLLSLRLRPAYATLCISIGVFVAASLL